VVAVVFAKTGRWVVDGMDEVWKSIIFNSEKLYQRVIRREEDFFVAAALQYKIVICMAKLSDITRFHLEC